MLAFQVWETPPALNRRDPMAKLASPQRTLAVGDDNPLPGNGGRKTLTLNPVEVMRKSVGQENSGKETGQMVIAFHDGRNRMAPQCSKTPFM